MICGLLLTSVYRCNNTRYSLLLVKRTVMLQYTESPVRYDEYFITSVSFFAMDFLYSERGYEYKKQHTFFWSGIKFYSVTVSN